MKRVVRNMDEMVEHLKAVISEKCGDFGLLDQEQIYKELSDELQVMAEDAVKREYLEDGL